MIAAAGQLGFALGSSVVSSISNAVTGSATNAARATRESWTLEMAKRGSTTAAAIVVAAPSNVSNNEAAGWRAELAQIPASVMAAASALYPGGWWPSGQPDFFTDVNGPTHRKIVAEVTAAGNTAFVSPDAPTTVPTNATSTGGSSSTATTGGAQQLPAVITTAKPPGAKPNYTVWIVVGVAVLLVIGLLVFRHRGAR